MGIFKNKKDKDQREYDQDYEQKVYFCKRCEIYHQVFDDKDPGKCHCCNRPIVDMPLKLHQAVKVKRRVKTIYKDPDFKE